MSATAGKIEDILRGYAPFETAESYDNVGLLIGAHDREVKRILVALDCTMDVVKEAEQLSAELIVSHHPLFFHARRNMVEEDSEARIVCEMIRKGLSLISVHTNLDKTDLSGSASCAKLLKLQNVRQEGYLFIGDFKKEMTAEGVRRKMNTVLPFPVRVYGNNGKMIKTLAIGGGACDEEWSQAMAAGAQAMLTGEVRHHNALGAEMNGFVIFDGGHYGTEQPLVPYLTEYLQRSTDELNCGVQVVSSCVVPFGNV